jgi:general secretion pathway protein G
MRAHPRTRRGGFSLIELLIVVAIIAALVGVAVPFFQDNLSEAQRTKAGQDLEVIKKAISLYDARESRPLVGTALEPLLGRYMQELPRDPWGNTYLFDGAAGVLASYGADALPQGSGGDTDIVVYTKPPLMINRVQYQGSWGRPNCPYTGPPAAPIPSLTQSPSEGNKFIITLTKPADRVTNAGTPPTGEIVLLRQVGNQQLGNPVLLTDGAVWVANTWLEGTDPAFGVSDPLHRPEVGVMTIRAAATNVNIGTNQAITPTMALDFACVTAANDPCPDGATYADGGTVGTSIMESTYQGISPVSPLDSTVYGAAVSDYRRKPQPMELVNNQRRGTKLEKY